MRYAVFGCGQRLRPLLALRIARMLGSASALNLRAAASVELLHCASLIVDDLPCMDDSHLRRNRPALHVAFGEANALLAAFGLIALAARSVIDLNCRPWELPCLLEFQVRLLSTLDCDSMIAGQSLDLALGSGERDAHRIRLATLKTVPLFELAVRAGSLFARLSATEEQCLLDFGREFGLAYQLRDDLDDGEIDTMSATPDPFARARECLAPFGHRSAPLAELMNYLDAKKHSRHR
jgi:geranylgeranyl pyrophosphate synthase